MAEAIEVDAVRRFTRFYTRQIELLSETLLSSGFTLAEARVLYELAQRPGVAASTLSRDLDLDPGYLSRILKSFEARCFLGRTASEEDGRRAAIHLTPAGRAAFAPLDAASAAQVSRLLDRLPQRSRAELVQAMGSVERLLSGDAATPPIVLRRHRVGDLGWIAHRQGLLYAAEYGWDATFEALVAEILAGFVRSHDPERERAWIAEREGSVLGSVFLVRQSEETAKLRLLYVEPAARGLGLGARLVDACIGFAREAGYRALTLWTNDVLVAARRIYLAAGFELAGTERHRSFGQDLVGETWTLPL
jgi:DNA-binding MarR family transcriptional regulator/N-acetylglutamate synthase-like GNAT family acetyltransferase